MVDLTRRWFLGGTISLVAVTTSALPKIIGNMPQIWGDGSHDDTGGISALLRSEPVIFTRDKVTVDSHQGITFHNGVFKISRTLEIPDECNLTMDRPTFRAPHLPDDEPLFRVGSKHQHAFAAASGVAFANVMFLLPWRHGPIIQSHQDTIADDEGLDTKRSHKLRFAQEENGDISYTSLTA